jgi:hypothetical protein
LTFSSSPVNGTSVPFADSNVLPGKYGGGTGRLPDLLRVISANGYSKPITQFKEKGYGLGGSWVAECPNESDSESGIWFCGVFNADRSR